MPPDPNELLGRASTLAAGATQADLRRAISDAYYAVFHAFATAAADMVCGGSAGRSSQGYSLVYRSIDHKTLRSLCAQLSQTNPQNVAVVPSVGLGNISNLAGLVVNLQGQRLLADYEPSETYTDVRAKAAISDATQILAWFNACVDEQQKAFLTMLLFRQR